MELKSSRKDEPMVSVTFVTETKKEIAFKQIITERFQINLVNELLQNLDTETDIRFKNYIQYDDLINKVFSCTNNHKYDLSINNINSLNFYTVQVA